MAISEKSLANLRPAKPGEVRNPLGRPKIPKDVKEMARALVPEAIKILGQIMRDKEATPPARVSAASVILDRAYGKPAQTVNAHVVRTVIDATDAELAAIAFGRGAGDAEAEGSEGEPHGVH
jgi:hypothetical protein